MNASVPLPWAKALKEQQQQQQVQQKQHAQQLGCRDDSRSLQTSQKWLQILDTMHVWQETNSGPATRTKTATTKRINTAAPLLQIVLMLLLLLRQ